MHPGQKTEKRGKARANWKSKSELSEKAKPLFISGPARSGTTAFADYLNQHEEVLVCRERYKRVPQQIDPSFFTFDRILDYEPQKRQGVGETDTPVEYHMKLLARKDPTKLKWVGDKHPGYVFQLPTIFQNNPRASFILTYRPIEEVAESFEARSKDPQDLWLGGKDGFMIGVASWNRAMRNTRKLIESGPNSNVLVISYHDFFYRNEECIPLISRFLDLEFNESVRKAWRETSSKFESERRQKEPLSKERVAFIEKRKDYAAEEWVLARIEEQWRELNVATDAGHGTTSQRQGAGADLGRERTKAKIQARVAANLERRVGMLKNSLVQERRRTKLLERKNRQLERRNRQLERRNQQLELQVEDIWTSRSWRLLNKLGRLRVRVPGRKR